MGGAVVGWLTMDIGKGRGGVSQVNGSAKSLRIVLSTDLWAVGSHRLFGIRRVSCRVHGGMKESMGWKEGVTCNLGGTVAVVFAIGGRSSVLAENQRR